MAEDIGVDIATKIIEKLGSAAIKKFKSVKDLNSHIEKLREIKLIIAAELHKCDPFEASTDLEGYKIKRIQRVHDELVHLFEEQETRAMQKEVMGGSTITAQARLFFSPSNQLVSSFRIDKKVNAITKELKSIASDYAQYSSILSHSSGNQNRCTLSEETSPFPDTSVLIGRDTDKENIVKMICNSSNDHVAAIVGVGGQGKTTLAQHVCQDDRVKSRFDKRLWVSLTPKSTVNEIYEKIIASATGEKSNYCSLEQLHHQVFEAITGKCLLVLDNVYYSKNLRDNIEALSSKLQQGCFWRNGGKVLITSRSEKVAEQMHTSKPYKLRELAEDDCWRLLRHYAIELEEKKKECGVEEIGKEIARMCPKMPLVLKTIGCYLADKDYKSQWEHLRNELALNPTLYIEQQDKIKQILKLCYDQLDYNLKRCAAFCSQFPKGHVYNKNGMLRYWIALGLVESRGGISLQDVGDAYVLELTQRAFFEEAGNFEDFKMHDVMHDLMLLIGKDKHQMIDSKTKSIVEGVRHVCLNMQDLNWDVLLSSISSKQTLESILLASSHWDNHVDGMPLRSGIKKLLSACQNLKVLELYWQEIVKVPRSIGELTLVKHLNLSGNLFCKLPNEITKMVNLLTLDLSHCWNLQELPTEMGKLVNLSSLNLKRCCNLEELPRDMGKLVKLRHLWVTGCGLLTCMPEGFGNLRELEILDEFVVGESSSKRSKGKGGAKLEELGHLKNLTGELCIRVAGESKYIVSEAGNAHLELEAKLSRLQIRFEKKGEEDEKFLEGIQLSGENWKQISIKNYGGKKLPAWMTDDQFHKRFPKLDSLVLGRTYSFSGLHDKDGFMSFRVEGNEDELGEWVPRYSRIKEHLKMGLIELQFRTRRRDGVTLTHVTEDVTLHDVHCRIKGELARRSSSSSSSGGGQRQPAILLKSCFPNLTHLCLWDIPELEFLPEEFRDLSSLKFLNIWECGKLKAIPDWIDTLSSLKVLRVVDCPEVKVLPDSIGSLTSLSITLEYNRRMELLPHQIGELPKFCELHILACSKALYEEYTNPTATIAKDRDLSLGPRRATRSQTRSNQASFKPSFIPRRPTSYSSAILTMSNIETQLAAIMNKLIAMETKIEAQEKLIEDLKQAQPEPNLEGPQNDLPPENDPQPDPEPQPKTDAEKRVEKLEEMVQKLAELSIHQKPSNADFEFKGSLPKKVVLSDLPRFKGIEDPEDHLRAFNITLALKGMGKELFASVFPLTLDAHPSKWFKSLNKTKVDDWDYIKEEFIKQYRYNTQLPVGLRELEATKQGEKEDFSHFLNRWREKAAQMTNRPSEEDQVRIVIRNLQPKYQDHLKFQAIDSFSRLYKVGLLIEEELQTQKIKGNNGGFQKKGTSASSSSIEIGSVSTNPKPQRPQRTFTPLGMGYEQAFDRLVQKGALEPIGPTPEPPEDKKTKGWNGNAYCKYHRGNRHTTESCWSLKHKLQNMIEDGSLPIPPAAKAKPNARTNPLPSF